MFFLGASTSSSQSTTPASKPVAVLIQVFNFILLVCLTSYLTTPTSNQRFSKSPSSLPMTAATSIVQCRHHREISTRSLTAYFPIDSKFYCPAIFASAFNLFSRYYNFYYLSQVSPTSTTVDAQSVLYYENSW